ncbi:hypothetical protein BsWGS_13733 [Bradybaena similaris]
MSMDKPSRHHRKDTKRPFKMYNVVQFSNGSPNHQAMTLPNIPFTTQQTPTSHHLSPSEQQQHQQIHLSQSQEQQQLQQTLHLQPQEQQQPQQMHHLPQPEQQQLQEIRLLQSQDLQQHQDPQSLSSQLNPVSLQLFGGHVNFQENISHQQQSIQNVIIDLDPASFLYDRFGLGGSGSDLLTSSEPMTQQGKPELNISPWNLSRNLVQNVCLTSESASKPSFDALLPMQEPQAVMFDNLLATSSSSLTGCVVTPIATNSFSVGNDQLLHNRLPLSYNNIPFTSQLHNMQFSSSGVSQPGTSMNSMIHTGQFHVKLETSMDNNVRTLGKVNKSAAPPPINESNEHYFQKTTVVKKFPETSSLPASMPLVNASVGNLPSVPLHSAPQGHFYQDSFTPATRRTRSECSTSSTSASFDDSVTSPTGHKIDGETSKDDSSKDSSYLEKRRKNNESAKKSRDARRNKETAIARKVLDFETQNCSLKAQIQVLESDNQRMRMALHSFDQMDQCGLST